VQVDPIKPTLKAPGTKRLKLKHDEVLSKCAFKINLRRYTQPAARAAAVAAQPAAPAGLDQLNATFATTGTSTTTSTTGTTTTIAAQVERRSVPVEDLS
jgi:hypothetical protein